MSHRITVGAGLMLVALVACERLQPVDRLQEEARHYQAQGDLRAAVIQLRNAVVQRPADAALRRMLGELYLEQGDAASAEKELRQTLALGHPRTAVLPILGKVMLSQGEFRKLLAELATDPDSATVLALRGDAQLGLGQPDLAAPLYRQALQLQAGHVHALLGLARLALRQNRLPEALRHVEQAIVAQPKEIEALRFKGDILRAQGQLEATRQAYEAILKLRPDVQARIDLASLAIGSGNLDLARQQIAAARKSQPGSPMVHYGQALLDHREGKHKQALAQLQQILRGAPDHPPSLMLAAQVELALGNHTQAEMHVRKFLRSAPQQPYATRLLATLAMRAQQPDEALRLLQPLLENDPPDAALLALAGEAAMLARRFEMAAGYYERASRLHPDAPALRTGLGMSRLGMGQHQRAVAELEQAAGKDGAGARPGLMLVLTYMRGNEHARAMQQIDAMIRQGDNPMLQNLRAGVLAASGDMRGARAALGKALQLDALYMPALDNLTQLDLREKKPEQARQRLLAALKQNQRHLGVLTTLSRLAAGAGRSAESIEWMERASAAWPDAIEPAAALVALQLNAGARDKALTLARKLHAEHPARPELLALLAHAESERGEHGKALESYVRLAALQPASAAVQMRIALTQSALGNAAEATHAVRRALALEPERDEALALLSALLIRQKALPQAIVQAQAIQRRRPQDALGFRLEGDALQAQGRHDEALKRYERGFELMRTGPLIIAIHRALRAAGKQAAASERMEQWLATHPADAATRLYFASALQQDRACDAASEHYQRILDDQPDNVLALNDLAWCYLQLSDKRAQAHAERAYQLAPHNPAVADTLAMVLIRQGQPARALQLLKKALQQAPAAPDIRLHYAQALFQAGDKPGARAQCEQLLALPDFAQRAEVEALMAKL